jgi:hypothetical protein
MPAETIGPATCPLCRGRARVSLSSKGLPVLTCNGCNIQLFARSDRSDDLVRALLLPADAPALTPAPVAEPEAKPVAASKPVPAPTPSPQPVAPVLAPVAPPAGPKKSGFGLQSWF